MKINEELERLLSVDQYRKQSQSVGNSGGDGFESLLAQQLKTGQNQDASALAALADPLRLANINVAAMAGLEQEEGKSPDDQLVETLTGGMASTLDGFDKMAASLQSNAPDALKDAWSALRNLDGELAGLREEMGRLSKPNTELESMLNELEVLAATERFKFNRGDYL